jgi:DNA-binding SARP family transcriptional activator/streptogramin lyase
MDFRILGPMEVTDGDRAIAFAASKQRALLGVLLLHPGEVVSSERLIDELWGERPPATAAKVLQTYIFQLRRALGAGLIATRPPGYLLAIDEGSVDAGRFRHMAARAGRLVTMGQPEQADPLYREALALWRGPPLADVAFESFARNEVERLDEERLAALTARIDCELALGQHEPLVAELESLVGQYRLRERLRAQLMLALYRSGRQADALAAYQDARRSLVDELGLEPSRELQDLERAILSHDGNLEATSQSTVAAPDAGELAPALLKPVVPPRRSRKPLLAIGLAILLLPPAALGVAAGLNRGQSASRLLRPDSIGFVDARSGRVTRSIPVGRYPVALTVAGDSVWVANYADGTVTRINRATGRSVTIGVQGHPTGLTYYLGTLWVWTIERQLVPVDPRFDSAGNPIPVGLPPGTSQVGRIPTIGPDPGRIVAGGGFLWVAAPLTTVVRVDPTNPGKRLPIVPDDGVVGAIAYDGGQVWVAGAYDVFPITANTGIPGAGAPVGIVHGIAFGAGSVWVVSGGPAHQGGVAQALRRVDPHTRLVQATVTVGNLPISVASAAGSIWVASPSDGAIERVDPKQDRVVQTIRVGTGPIAVTADDRGVWVSV